jgi:hypothetical protein
MNNKSEAEFLAAKNSIEMARALFITPIDETRVISLDSCKIRGDACSVTAIWRVESVWGESLWGVELIAIDSMNSEFMADPVSGAYSGSYCRLLFPTGKEEEFPIDDIHIADLCMTLITEKLMES